MSASAPVHKSGRWEAREKVAAILFYRKKKTSEKKGKQKPAACQKLLRAVGINCCQNTALKLQWRRQLRKWTPAIYMLELVCLQKFPDIPGGWWQCTTMPPIGRFESIFLMTCCPGELFWRLCFTRDRPSTVLCHACVLQLLQCASCSRFAVKLLLLVFELLLACTMAPLPSTCGYRWGNWPVKYVLYSLLRSLKFDLIP